MKGYVMWAICMTLVFWNVENLFEDRPGFSQKTRAISKTIMMIADEEGDFPDVIALAEVENAKVLKRLVYGTVLSKLDYRIVHYESPDHRGIDCALLYRKSEIRVIRSYPKHLYDSSGRIMATRDILVAESDSLAILVNHHPSKVGSGGEWKRKVAMARMMDLCDSLERRGHHRILCVGDFNDNMWGPFRQGTIKYNGKWDKIDGHFQRGLTVEERVYTSPHLTTEDRSFGGEKPFRAYSGPRYTGGVSDHYPIVLRIFP